MAMQAALKLPIAARGEADPSAAGIRGLSTPSRSRRAGPQTSPASSPAQALLCTDFSGGASYREQLRASGKQALLQVREGARSQRADRVASPVALADKIAAPSFGAAHAALPRGYAAAPEGSPFGAAVDQQVPLVFVHPAAGAPYAGPQATPSSFALADLSALTRGSQSAGGPHVVSFHCPGGNPGCVVSPHAALQRGGYGGAMEAPNFLVMAMPPAPAMGTGAPGMSGEELAAQLRAAAPDVYED